MRKVKPSESLIWVFATENTVSVDIDVGFTRVLVGT